MLEKYVQPAMDNLMVEQEKLLRQILNDCAPGWTLEEIHQRCRWVRTAGSPVETLMLDGEPVLEKHPLEFSPIENHGDRYVYRVTQNFRRLGRAASTVGDARGA